MFFYLISNKILLWMCAFIIFSLEVFCQNFETANTEKHPYRFIFSANLFQNSKPEDVEAATRIMVSKLKSKSNLEEDVEIVVCNSEEEIIKNLNEEFDFIYLSPVETMRFKDKYKLEPTLVTMTKQSYGDIFYLITNKKDNKKDIKSLKDGIIYILSKTQGQTPSIWLDKILRDKKLPNKEKFFKKIIYDFKSTNVVLPVFFKKASAAIVTSAAFELLCELNPQIKKEAEVIQTSKPILSGIFCFDLKNKNEKRKKFVADYLIGLHTDSYGKQITELYMVDKIVLFKESYWDNFLELYK